MPLESEDLQLIRYREGPHNRPNVFCSGVTTNLLDDCVFMHRRIQPLDGLVLLPEASGSVDKQVVTEASLRAAALNVRHLKATYPAAYIASFASAGFQELRRRTGMIASTNITVPHVSLPNSLRIRQIKEGDSDQIGTLLQRAYKGADEQHPDLASWRAEVRAIQDGQFGPFLADSCFVAEHALDRFHLAGAILVHLERNIPRMRHMVVVPCFAMLALASS